MFAEASGLWVPVGSAAAVFGTLAVFSNSINRKIKMWHETKDKEEAERLQEKQKDQKIMDTLFGAEGAPPFESVDGLVKQHEKTRALVTDLSNRINYVEACVIDVQRSVDKLLYRTEENNGSSLKDQLNRIENAVGNKTQEK